MIVVAYDSWEFHLLETYCLGKGTIWNMFFGWRKSVEKGINGTWCYYRIPNKKDREKIFERAEYLSQNIGYDGL